MLPVILRVVAAMVKQRRRQWSHWYCGSGKVGSDKKEKKKVKGQDL
jgi:hypothetical protein